MSQVSFFIKRFSLIEQAFPSGGNRSKLLKLSHAWRAYYTCLARRLGTATKARMMPNVILMVFQGAVARLPCKLCSEPGRSSHVKWMYTRHPNNSFAEVETSDRMTVEHGTMTIYSVGQADEGVFWCMLGAGRAGLVILEITDTEPYTVVKPKTSRGPHAVAQEIYQGITLSTRWSRWSECSVCGKVGRRHRYGVCYVNLHRDLIASYEIDPNRTAHANTLVELDDKLIELFQAFPTGLPCRSQYLPKTLRDMKALQERPSEIMIGMCKVPCSSSPDVEIEETTKPKIKTWHTTKPRPKPGDTTKPSSKPGRPIKPSPKPGHPIKPTGKPGHPTKPSPKPGNPTKPSPKPGHPTKPSTKPSPKPGHPIKPTAKPGHPTKPSLKPGHPITAGPKPGQPIKPSPKPEHPIKPRPPGHPTKPSPKPGHTIKPTPIPGHPTKPSPKPGHPTKPCPKPGHPSKPSTKPSPKPGHPIKPTAKPGHLTKPNAKPGHTDDPWTKIEKADKPWPEFEDTDKPWPEIENSDKPWTETDNADNLRTETENADKLWPDPENADSLWPETAHTEKPWTEIKHTKNSSIRTEHTMRPSTKNEYTEVPWTKIQHSKKSRIKTKHTKCRNHEHTPKPCNIQSEKKPCTKIEPSEKPSTKKKHKPTEHTKSPYSIYLLIKHGKKTSTTTDPKMLSIEIELSTSVNNDYTEISSDVIEQTHKRIKRQEPSNMSDHNLEQCETVFFSMKDFLPKQPPMPVRNTIFAVFGERIALRCPGTTLRDVPIMWRRGTKALVPRDVDKGSGGRVHINSRDHLVFTSVYFRDENLYSCWERGRLAGSVQLVVRADGRARCRRPALLAAALAIALLLLHLTRPDPGADRPGYQ
ncbi:hypothetical protein B5X24_HaOG204902 [Helicoverpa armigera]|uniref:Ig-like domain-containing protein n=1 Tax=Helicoverpa armigera TaxID=29058 RepID=A0A2W1BMB7_HELAM|nr:hypothetical protein B5X24_HaOG204902 [Helicoverpa armigera]